MINISRHEDKVKLTIEHGLSSHPNGSLLLYWNTGDAKYAELLSNKLQQKLWDTVEAVRKEEYERGWKDAKAKKAKTTWFASILKLGIY